MITALLSSWSEFWDDAGKYLTEEWGGLKYWMWFAIAILVVVAVILVAVYAAKGSKRRKEMPEECSQSEDVASSFGEEQPRPDAVPYVYDAASAYEEEPAAEPVYEEEPESVYESESEAEHIPESAEEEHSWYTNYVDESISEEDEHSVPEYVPPVEEKVAPVEEKTVPVEEKAAPVEEEASVRVYVQTEYGQKPLAERTTETYYGASRAAEKVYHVSKRRLDGKWQVKASKSTKVIRLFDKYREAIEYAKKLAISQGTRVIIHKADGTFSKISFDSRQ